MAVSGVGRQRGKGGKREREREEVGGKVCIKTFFFPVKISKKRQTFIFY